MSVVGKGGEGGFLLLLFSPGFTVTLTHLPPPFSHSCLECSILQHVRSVTFNSHLKFNQKYFQSALSVHFFYYTAAAVTFDWQAQGSMMVLLL